MKSIFSSCSDAIFEPSCHASTFISRTPAGEEALQVAEDRLSPLKKYFSSALEYLGLTLVFTLTVADLLSDEYETDG